MEQLPEKQTSYLSRVRSRLQRDVQYALSTATCTSSLGCSYSGATSGVTVPFEWLSALNAQIQFSKAETEISPEELVDPLGAERYRVTERLIHQYKNRVLLLSTDRCFAYCRFCFRKNFTGKNTGWISDEEIQKSCDYLRAHREVTEILISGGDPMTADNDALFSLLKAIRKASSDILIRIGTRSLFFAPQRFDADTIEKLHSFFPLWIIPHINHPLEISPVYTPEVVDTIKRIREAGIPMYSQTVLLKGVNDSVAVLHRLFHELVCLGIKPGYLFQLDLAQGTTHFRVPIEQALALYNDLKKELSGLSTPVFAVDMPGGGGKLNLEGFAQQEAGVAIAKTDSEIVVKKSPTSEEWSYPRA